MKGSLGSLYGMTVFGDKYIPKGKYKFIGDSSIVINEKQAEQLKKATTKEARKILESLKPMKGKNENS